MITMTVDEFNQSRSLSREKLQIPGHELVYVCQETDTEIQLRVRGKLRWLSKRKTPVNKPAQPKTCSEPEYTMDRSEIELGASAYMLLQWIRSLHTPNFSLVYAARELNMSEKTIRKSLQIIRDKGMIPQ